jgi:nucleoside-diphosphate-sugar epimerase
MRILILGATGYIGSAVLENLIEHHHSVLALARTAKAEKYLAEMGAEVLPGDLRAPQAWSHAIRQVDAVIHLAATFSEDMGDVDRALVDALTAEAMEGSRTIRFLYTGGCWLYGETGERVASEDSPFNPLPAFAWMLENFRTVLAAACFDGIFLHPAMVYDRDGGAFARFVSGAKETGTIEVIGSLKTRWPLVHREDLASAYRLALTKAIPGEAYNIAAQEGVPVGEIVRVIARRFGIQRATLLRSVPDAVAELGTWAAGPALDQQMCAEKARATLGWRPQKTDALRELA